MQEHSTTLGINNNLFTIIHEPESISDLKTAIVFINAGIIHRIGPNRIYVEQARLLASRGYLVVRFDISGIGDSNSINENNDLVESGICDTIEVIDYIKTKYNIHNVGLIGICSGADIAFEVSKIKKDVKSSLLINGMFFKKSLIKEIEKVALINTQNRYYKKSLLSTKRWRKALNGESQLFNNVSVSTIAKYAMQIILDKAKAKLKKSPNTNDKNENIEIDQMAWEKCAKTSNTYILYSEGSTNLEIFKLTLYSKIKKYFNKQNFKFKVIKNADHSFTLGDL